MLVPLAILALGSALAGYLSIPPFLASVTREGPPEHHAAWLPLAASLTAIVAIVAAVYLYVVHANLPARIGAALPAFRRVLEVKYGFDDLFNWVARRIVVDGGTRVLWLRADAGAIDGGVNGMARLVAWASQKVRVTQTGQVRAYALAIFGGAGTLLAYLLWAR